MLIEIKGYAKFEWVLWGEVDTGWNGMFVVKASVWRVGRRCGVVWLGWKFRHVVRLVFVWSRIHQGIDVYSWGLRHEWSIFCIPTQHFSQIPFIWPSFLHLWNPLQALAY
jgi:hypothetical protein